MQQEPEQMELVDASVEGLKVEQAILEKLRQVNYLYKDFEL